MFLHSQSTGSQLRRGIVAGRRSAPVIENESGSTQVSVRGGRIPAGDRHDGWWDAIDQLLEAAEKTDGIRDRVRYLANVSSKLDEFFMNRLPRMLQEARDIGFSSRHHPRRGDCRDQLEEMLEQARRGISRQYDCWNTILVPALKASGIQLVRPFELNKSQRKEVADFFTHTALPVLTPMAIDASHPSPVLKNGHVYLAALLIGKLTLGPERLYAVVALPRVLPRFVPLDGDEQSQYILLEDVILSHFGKLFGGYDLIESATFRVACGSNGDAWESRSKNPAHTPRHLLQQRPTVELLRIEVSAEASDDITGSIIAHHRLEPSHEDGMTHKIQIDRIPGPLELAALSELLGDDHQIQPHSAPAKCS